MAVFEEFSVGKFKNKAAVAEGNAYSLEILECSIQINFFDEIFLAEKRSILESACRTGVLNVLAQIPKQKVGIILWRVAKKSESAWSSHSLELVCSVLKHFFLSP
jgi:hypothetical protein